MSLWPSCQCLFGWLSAKWVRFHIIDNLYLIIRIENSTDIPYGEYPSCLHTTLASLLSQKSSQMVPQVSLTHTSTLPNLWYRLSPTSWRCPSLQGALKMCNVFVSLVNCLALSLSRNTSIVKKIGTEGYSFLSCLHITNWFSTNYYLLPLQITEASRLCPQAPDELECTQSSRVASTPEQPKFLKCIGPYPWPNWEVDAVPSVKKICTVILH